MSKTKDVPDIFCSSHSIFAPETRSFRYSFVLTETGSMRHLPNTLQFQATETAAEIGGSPGPEQATPGCWLIHCLIPKVSAMELPSQILIISVRQKPTQKCLLYRVLTLLLELQISEKNSVTLIQQSSQSVCSNHLFVWPQFESHHITAVDVSAACPHICLPLVTPGAKASAPGFQVPPRHVFRRPQCGIQKAYKGP
jgi:hypothetical protein